LSLTHCCQTLEALTVLLHIMVRMTDYFAQFIPNKGY
jgi:hypothetical protein